MDNFSIYLKEIEKYSRSKDAWLKDRKGKTLVFDDLECYSKVVSALSQTIELMLAIDEMIEENGGFPIE